MKRNFIFLAVIAGNLIFLAVIAVITGGIIGHIFPLSGFRNPKSEITAATPSTFPPMPFFNWPTPEPTVTPERSATPRLDGVSPYQKQPDYTPNPEIIAAAEAARAARPWIRPRSIDETKPVTPDNLVIELDAEPLVAHVGDHWEIAFRPQPSASPQ